MHLFVSGCPRSGTTALTRLLNLHPEIVVGLERYKGRYSQGFDLKPEMFSAEGFFDFQPADTNYQPAKSAEASAFYERARQKFAEAKFVGEKYPQFYRFYGPLFNNFPEAKIIFIVRNAVSVAQSWQRRSEDTSSWPAKNDARRSVSYWNDALAYTLAYSQIKKNTFTFVDFDQLFAAKEAGLFELFNWIGARLTPEMQAQIIHDAEPEFVRSATVLGRQISLGTEVLSDIARQTDPHLYEQALKIIQSQRAETPSTE